MSDAKKCDRCTVVYDLCPECQSVLESWLKDNEEAADDHQETEV